MKPITTLFIDFDGTLADSTQSMVGLINQLTLKYRLTPVEPQDYDQFRDLSLKNKLKKIGVRWYQVPFLVRDAQKLQHSEVKNLELIDGWKDALPVLSSQYALHIVSSNTQKTIADFLEHHNLGQYFSTIWADSSIFGKKKLIKKALASLKLQPNEVLYIGDEERDIEASKACDMRVIAVTWGFCSAQLLKSYQPDAVVGSVGELVGVVG